jgi:ditrans,polycis-polyprenyl diphosphate synthase
VTHVTIYAFSIENFKRSKYEVDALMDMARIKLTQLSQHGDLLDRYGACIRILGQRELIRPEVLEAVDRAVRLTAHNNKAVLNVCFPYTSREEITTAIRSTVEEWSRPVEQPAPEKGRPSPFREDRIAHTIRSQHLSDYNNRGTSTPPPTYLQPPGLQSPTSSTTSLASSLSNSESHSTISSSTTIHPETTEPSSPKATTTSLHNSASSTRPTTPPLQSLTSPTSPPASQSTYPSPELITPATITSHTFTGQHDNPPLDLLIRTSGVERLSDFMLWQCHETTEIVFLSVLWPEFDLWSFLPVLWEWQWRVQKEKKKLESRQAEAVGGRMSR